MTEPKTVTSDEILKLNRDYTLFSWSVQSAVNPIPVTGAQGVYFWGPDGTRYLDFSAQLMNVNIGHQHPKVVRAIQQQAEQLCFVQPAMATEPRGRLGQKLIGVMPKGMTKAFFALGGAEANENAIKMVRQITGRHKLISRYHSYHGATLGAVALTGDHRRWRAEPTMPGVVHVFAPYCYRCDFGWTPETCHRECISHIETVINLEGPDQIAGIFLEGITGTNGVLIPPDDYWPRLRAMADRYGILLISDEVMSGFGRTGKWFAVDHWDVTPDLITMAKGLTSGYVPLAAVVVSERVAEFYEDEMLWCGLTYSSHPLACAAAVATLEVYQEDRLIENAAQLGLHLGERLEELKARHPSVGDVRYIGLFSAIELVSDRTTKEPMALPVMKEMGGLLRDRGLYVFMPKHMILIVPPLCITQDQLDEGLGLIDQALDIADRACSG